MPDNLAYLLLGLLMMSTVLGGYIGSLFLRFRRAAQAQATLESVRKP